MKKLIFFFVLGAILNVSAEEDSYLYWMVSNDASGWGWDGKQLSGGGYQAKIVAFNGSEWAGTGGTYLDIGVNDYGSYTSLNSTPVTFGSGANNFQYLAKLATGTDWSSFSYFVEIYHDSQLLAHSEVLPYTEASIAVLSGLNTPSTPWMAVNFTPAPEPNSALLMLIGCAALALRRRKQIAA